MAVAAGFGGAAAFFGMRLNVGSGYACRAQEGSCSFELNGLTLQVVEHSGGVPHLQSRASSYIDAKYGLTWRSLWCLKPKRSSTSRRRVRWAS